MPVSGFLLVLQKKHRKPGKRIWLISRILPLILSQSYDIYSKWLTGSCLVDKDIATESKDSLFKAHQADFQA